MKASIVTVCYNTGSEIISTIESVISQKGKNDIEFIIIDGDSKDNTLDIISTYSDNIDVLVSEPDMGIYDAMNKGIRLSTGDIIGFMNSGDAYADGAIECVIKCFKDTDADVVYGDALYSYEGRITGGRKGSADGSVMLTSIVSCHQAIFVKADLQRTHEFDLSYKIAADRKMLLDLFLEGYRFERVDNIIARYDISGFSSKHKYEFHIEYFRITYETYVKYPELYTKQKNNICDDIFLFEFWHDWDSTDIRLFEGISNVFHSTINNTKRILIWGTGIYGDKAETVFSKLGYNLAGFIDSDLSKRRKGHYTVFSPNEINPDKNSVIIIATRQYADEIANQMNSLENVRSTPYFVFVDMLIEYEKHMGKTIESILYGGKEA